VVAQVCDRVAMMYRGEVVQPRPPAKPFANPRQSYVGEVLAAIPSKRWLQAVAG